jgi:hypothetical protein
LTSIGTSGIHGGLPPRIVGVIAAIAFIFGASVLLATALDSSPAASDGAHSAPAAHVA